ncbi:MAG: DUF123 domain-containing protein [Halobacteria archaeon]
MSDGGCYVLCIELTEEACIEIGALGKLGFDPGFYLYVGSAFGPGGLERIERHRDVSMGRNDTRMWHLDYLNGFPETVWRTVWCYEGDVECSLASILDERFDGVYGFGCSDCDCNSHLFYVEDFDEIVRTLSPTEP